MTTSTQPQLLVQNLSPEEHSPRLGARWREYRGRLSACSLLRLGHPDTTCAAAPTIAIVGTRRPSSYGLRFVREFVSRLKGLGCTVISGGALGIDGEVHAAALRAGVPTQAWLVGPIRRPNPSSHLKLFEKIMQSPGGALWVPEDLEPKPGFPVQKSYWIQRNQWLVASCDLLVVVEARKPSGTWSSAQAAAHFGVPTFLLPGPLYSPESLGTNSMILEGCGQPIVSVDHLVQTCIVELKLSSYNERRASVAQLGPGGDQLPMSSLLRAEFIKLLNNFNGLSLPELWAETLKRGWSQEIVVSILQDMLQNGEIQVLGDHFERRGYES